MPSESPSENLSQNELSDEQKAAIRYLLDDFVQQFTAQFNSLTQGQQQAYDSLNSNVNNQLNNFKQELETVKGQIDSSLQGHLDQTSTVLRTSLDQIKENASTILQTGVDDLVNLVDSTFTLQANTINHIITTILNFQENLNDKMVKLQILTSEHVTAALQLGDTGKSVTDLISAIQVLYGDFNTLCVDINNSMEKLDKHSKVLADYSSSLLSNVVWKDRVESYAETAESITQTLHNIKKILAKDTRI